MEYFSDLYYCKLYNKFYNRSTIHSMYEYCIYTIFSSLTYTLHYVGIHNDNYNKELMIIGRKYIDRKYIDDDKTRGSCILNNSELVWWY